MHVLKSKELLILRHTIGKRHGKPVTKRLNSSSINIP